MKPTVWVVSNSGRIDREDFDNENSSIQFAKQRSDTMNNMCCVQSNGHKRMFIYENGTTVTAPRRVELSKIVEEMIMSQINREAKAGMSDKARK